MEMNNIPEMFQSKLRLMIVSGLIKQPLSFSALKQLTGQPTAISAYRSASFRMRASLLSARSFPVKNR